MDSALTPPCWRYGNREAFTGRLVDVIRPDGSVFTQVDTATYTVTEVAPAALIAGRSSRHEGTPRKFASGGIRNTLTQESATAGNRAFSVREVNRVLSDGGLMWLVSVEASDGRRATVNRLRGHRAGRGGPWVYAPS